MDLGRCNSGAAGSWLAAHNAQGKKLWLILVILFEHSVFEQLSYVEEFPNLLDHLPL